MRNSCSIKLAVRTIATSVLLFSTLSALAQECPQRSATGATVASAPRTIEGSLIYHNDIRHWFELRLDQPQCGQSSIQLVVLEGTWTALEVLRGCRVKSTGPIDFSGTGYYSLDTYQNVRRIETVGSCTRQLAFPDYSKERPDDSVREYRVDMYIKYAPGDHPIKFRITSSGKELHPWQAYASYLLTGGFVLYGHCGEGFVVDKVFGTPEAKPSHFDEPRTENDMAAFDPESAAALGKKDLHLSYTCVRDK
jgi:hypothetical protein